MQPRDGTEAHSEFMKIAPKRDVNYCATSGRVSSKTKGLRTRWLYVPCRSAEPQKELPGSSPAAVRARNRSSIANFLPFRTIYNSLRNMALMWSDSASAYLVPCRNCTPSEIFPSRSAAHVIMEACRAGHKSRMGCEIGERVRVMHGRIFGGKANSIQNSS